MRKQILFLSALLLPLSVLAQEVEETVVSATLRPTVSGDINSAITILTSHDLSRGGQVFLIDALRFVPALSITQEGGVGALSAVRIRGGESDHVKVFIDGVEVNDTSSGAFDMSQLLSSQIERVEIVRGAQSLIHGANATAGVIYITTKTGAGADFRLSAGSYRTLDVGGNIGGESKGFYFNIGGELYRTKGHDISAQGIFEPDDYVNGTVNLKLGFDKNFDRQRVQGASSVRYVGAQFNGDSFSRSNRDGQSLQTISQIEAGLRLSHHWTLPSDFVLNQTVSGALMRLDRNTTGSFPLFTDQDRNHIDYKITAYMPDRIKLFDRDVDLSLTALVGWEETILKQNRDSLRRTEDERFVAGEIQFGYQGIDLTAGMRGQFYRRSEDDVLWRVTAGWTPPNQTILRLRGSYGTSLNRPTLYQLYGFSLVGFTPNPNLEPEHAVSWDGGWDLDFTPLFDRFNIFSLSASAFGIDVTDEITGFRSPVNNPGTSERIGAEVGAEWGMDFAFIKDMRIGATYTYTRAKQANGRPSLNRPKHVLSLKMDWRIAALGMGWDMSWQSYQLAYNGRIGSYPILNLYGSYDVNDALALFVRGENLTDERTANTVGYKRRGRGIYIGLSGRL